MLKNQKDAQTLFQSAAVLLGATNPKDEDIDEVVQFQKDLARAGMYK